MANETRGRTAGALAQGFYDFARLFGGMAQEGRARRERDDERAHRASREAVEDQRYADTVRREDTRYDEGLAMRGITRRNADQYRTAKQTVEAPSTPGEMAALPDTPHAAPPPGALASGMMAAVARDAAASTKGEMPRITGESGGSMFEYNPSGNPEHVDRVSEHRLSAAERRAAQEAAFRQQERMANLEHGFRLSEIGASRQGVGASAATARNDSLLAQSAVAIARAALDPARRRTPGAGGIYDPERAVRVNLRQRFPSADPRQIEALASQAVAEVRASMAPRVDATANPADARQRAAMEFTQPRWDSTEQDFKYPDLQAGLARADTLTAHLYPSSASADGPTQANAALEQQRRAWDAAAATLKARGNNNPDLTLGPRP